MIPNNYPNSDFYSVFPNSKILSEPKLANISDISNTKQQITKDVFSKELKDKTKTNLPLQDRENLNNSKIGILNYFIPKKDEKMSDVSHFELRKA